MLPTNRSRTAEIPLAPHESGGEASFSQVTALGQAALSALGQSAKETHRAKLQTHLQAWCDEKAETPEHAKRLEAKKRIKSCFCKSSSCLDLSSLELTSLPNLHGFSFLALKQFDCSQNRLTALFDVSLLMPNLAWLDCSKNHLGTPPDFSRVMPTLAWFDSSNNHLGDLPKTMIDQGTLRSLGHTMQAVPLEPLARARLQAWCDEQVDTLEYVKRLTAKERIENCLRESLSCLDVSSLELTSLPNFEGFSFPALKEFICSNNYLEALPNFSSIMPALKLFDCSDNLLTELPDLSLISTLERFDCRNNQLAALPDLSLLMPNLERLDCSGNRLKALPEFSLLMLSLKTFDCSDNLLPELPELSDVMVALQTFNCRNNKLVALPDLSLLMPNLESLDCSGNRLRALPDFSRMMPALEGFDCSRNRIVILPDLSLLMPNLERLDCSRNRIVILPEFSFLMPALEWFYCSINRLRALPDFSYSMPALKVFTCSENRLKALPAFKSPMLNLKMFWCARNSLEALPDFSQVMPTLRQFDCSSNQIRVLPYFSRAMPALKTFYCSNNKLTRIPETMLKWARDCEIHAERNSFSATYNPTLQLSLDRIRGSNPTLGPQLFLVAETPLDQTITLWLKAFELAFPKTSHVGLWRTLDDREFPSSAAASASAASGAAAGASSATADSSFLSVYQVLLDHENKEALNLFLHALKKTADYRNPSSRNNMIFKVQRFLSGATHNKAFRDHLFLLIDEALSSCGDRVSFYLGKIEVQWKLDCEGIGFDQLELTKLLIGVKRIELLETQTTQIVTQHHLGDAIETFLYCQVKLKKVLKLPLSTEGMLYAAMAGVTPAMLTTVQRTILAQTTSKEAIYTLLCESDYWIESLQQNLTAGFEKIIQEGHEALEALDSEMQEVAYLAETDHIDQEQKERKQSLVSELTQSWLDSHYRELSL